MQGAERHGGPEGVAGGPFAGLRSRIQMAGIIVGPIISGFIFDTSGSYTIAFLGFSGSSDVSMVLLLFAKPPKRRPRSESRAAR